jgi:lysophospholipase L1-like esterase
MSPTPDHRRELARFTLFLGTSAVLAGATYVVPGAEDVRPWVAGEPLPLVHLFQGDDDTRVVEDAQGELIAVVDPEPATVGADVVATPASPEPTAPAPLPERPPALATPLELPDGAWDAFFTALARAEDHEPGRIVRVYHWGDSTIAGDGITSTVRARLQERFGDGGPGFLAVQVDPRWALRPNIARRAKGDWVTSNITFGGAEHARYGLAGTVSVAPADAAATSTIGGLAIDGARQRLDRFEVWYQTQPGGGSFSLSAKGAAARVSTDGGLGDGFRAVEPPEGAKYVTVATHADGPVAIYGVVAETKGPGVTWESFGVAGASIASLLRQGRQHLAGQVAHRPPDLVVYMTGGNELKYDGLDEADGGAYRKGYIDALRRLRAGAPDAACLIVAPLDQAVRQRGKVVSKAMLGPMVEVQRAIAAEQGCAFWDARHVMGGDGGFARWLAQRPALAQSDLMHLSAPGHALVGDSLADAILVRYDAWRAAHPEVRGTAEASEPSTTPAQ